MSLIWTETTFPGSDTGAGTVVGGLFVLANASVIDTGRIHTSPDGFAWTARSIPVAENAISAVTGSGTAVVVYDYSAQCASSSDGITWTARTMAAAAKSWLGVAHLGATFCAIGSGRESYTSADGITWTAHATALPIPPSGTWAYNGYPVMASNGSVFLAITDYLDAATSTDGVTWTLRAIPAGPGGYETSRAALYSFNGVFYLICPAQYTDVYYTSPDGINWTERNFPNQGGAPGDLWRNMGYDGTNFVALEYVTGKTVTSFDGISWSAADTVATFLSSPYSTPMLSKETDVFLLRPNYLDKIYVSHAAPTPFWQLHNGQGETVV